MNKIRNRQDNLLKLVAVFPLRASVLAKMLDVHTSSIYKDIDYLHSRNKIKIKNCVYGMEISAR